MNDPSANIDETQQVPTGIGDLPSPTVVGWLLEEVSQRERNPLGYGKHDAYDKDVYSKSFGQYSKS